MFLTRGEFALDEGEVAAITRRKRPTAQARVLRESKIPFLMIDGRPVVSRAALVETLTGGRHTVGPQLRLQKRA